VIAMSSRNVRFASRDRQTFIVTPMSHGTVQGNTDAIQNPANEVVKDLGGHERKQPTSFILVTVIASAQAAESYQAARDGGQDYAERCQLRFLLSVIQRSQQRTLVLQGSRSMRIQQSERLGRIARPMSTGFQNAGR
jgi:hypothetical protein